jgi:hypothetical protein
VLSPDFLRRVSGDELTVPELRTPFDLSILEGIGNRFPCLSAAGGWNVRFGRELNATEDRDYFRRVPPGLKILEGKHIAPFRADPDRPRMWITRRNAARLLDETTFGRPRLAYRDVASATNRLSLIAAVLPPGVVTTHSLFCLKTPLRASEQAFLCGMLNSFVANYLVRLTLTTHLGSRTIEKLRVPRPANHTPLFMAIASLAMTAGRDARAYAELQGLAALAYGIGEAEFRHILSTLPLVPEADRLAALDAFVRHVGNV